MFFAHWLRFTGKSARQQAVWAKAAAGYTQSTNFPGVSRDLRWEITASHQNDNPLAPHAPTFQPLLTFAIC